MIKYDLVGYNNQVNLNTLDLPLYVYIELTDACNFNCKFCSVDEKNKNFISLDLFKKILLELNKNNIYDVYYTGGEPMLHPQFKEIVEYADNLGFRQTVLTNGSLINKYEGLLDKLMCVCFSLHGSRKIHNYLTNRDNYDNLVENIKTTTKYTNAKINYTVINENQNISETKKVLELAKKINVEVSFSKYNNIGLGKKNNCSIDIGLFADTLSELRKQGYSFGINDCMTPCLLNEELEYLSHGCGAGYLFASITCDGDVKICPSSTTKLGNIKNQSLRKIWHQKKLKEYRDFNWIPLYCKSCKNLSKCRCGCKIELSEDITQFNDYNVNLNKNEIWDKIKNKKMIINISLLRKEKKNYVSLSNPPRKYNKQAIDIITKLNEGVVPAQINNSKDFVLSLYRDKIIKEVE